MQQKAWCRLSLSANFSSFHEVPSFRCLIRCLLILSPGLLSPFVALGLRLRAGGRLHARARSPRPTPGLLWGLGQRARPVPHREPGRGRSGGRCCAGETATCIYVCFFWSDRKSETSEKRERARAHMYSHSRHACAHAVSYHALLTSNSATRENERTNEKKRVYSIYRPDCSIKKRVLAGRPPHHSRQNTPPRS